MIDGSRQVSGSHRFLVGPPLLVALLFCFSFVLLQPHPPAKSTPTASTNQSLPLPTSPKQNLSDMTFTQGTPLPLLPVATTDAPAEVSPTAAATPRPAASKLLQSGSTSGQQTSISTNSTLLIIKRLFR